MGYLGPGVGETGFYLDKSNHLLTHVCVFSCPWLRTYMWKVNLQELMKGLHPPSGQESYLPRGPGGATQEAQEP